MVSSQITYGGSCNTSSSRSSLTTDAGMLARRCSFTSLGSKELKQGDESECCDEFGKAPEELKEKLMRFPPETRDEI